MNSNTKMRKSDRKLAKQNKLRTLPAYFLVAEDTTGRSFSTGRGKAAAALALRSGCLFCLQAAWSKWVWMSLRYYQCLRRCTLGITLLCLVIGDLYIQSVSSACKPPG